MNLCSKEVFGKNLSYYLDLWGKEQQEVAEAIGVASSTFNEWVKGKKFPRIDKIEKLADYFGILKSDLIEEKNKATPTNKIDEIALLLESASPEQMEEVIRYIRFVLLNRK